VFRAAVLAAFTLAAATALPVTLAGAVVLAFRRLRVERGGGETRWPMRQEERGFQKRLHAFLPSACWQCFRQCLGLAFQLRAGLVRRGLDGLLGRFILRAASSRAFWVRSASSFSLPS